jgi:hypothetical protein
VRQTDALIAEHVGWLEQVGEVELIGGWAEVGIAEAVATMADTMHYQVFLTSYDAVLVFVQNRTARSFEIHAVPAQGRKLPRPTRCAYRVVASQSGIASAPTS